MAEVRFGTDQLRNPVPSKLAAGINIFTIITGCVIAWLGTANFVPAHLSTILQSVLGLLLTIANALKPFFGVETDQKRVPINEVSGMDVRKQ